VYYLVFLYWVWCSVVKMVNQLLAGVHIAASAEAMALGACAELDTRVVYDIISHAVGNSWYCSLDTADGLLRPRPRLRLPPFPESCLTFYHPR